MAGFGSYLGSTSVLNTSDGSNRQVYVGDTDPNTDFTAATNDIWVNPTAVSDSIKYWTGAVWTSVVTAIAPANDVQLFTSGGTWTKPGGSFTTVTAHVFGGGGGGGGGYSGSSGASGEGGGGGGGGGLTSTEYPIGDLSSTETVAIGIGGTGGAANSAGSDGTDSTFSTGGNLATGGLGSGGAKGTKGAGRPAGGTGGTGTLAGGVGGNGGYGYDAEVPTVGTGPGGGGGGGGQDVSLFQDGNSESGAAGAVGAGGALGGVGGTTIWNGSSYDTTNPTVGDDANSLTYNAHGGGGGGGASAPLTQYEAGTAATGFTGGFPAGGGGGGGGERNSSATGQPGGTGAAGYVVVISETPISPDLISENNLDDVESAATSRTNLDVYSTTESDALGLAGTYQAITHSASGLVTLDFDNADAITGWKVTASDNITGFTVSNGPASGNMERKVLVIDATATITLVWTGIDVQDANLPTDLTAASDDYAIEILEVS